MLPDNVNRLHKTILCDKFGNQQLTLQITEIKNIAVSQLKQQDDLKKEDSLFHSANRVLLLTLSDGAKSIEAMELEYVQCLEPQVKVGSRVKINKGYMQRGMLLLTNQTVKIVQ